MGATSDVAKRSTTWRVTAASMRGGGGPLSLDSAFVVISMHAEESGSKSKVGARNEALIFHSALMLLGAWAWPEARPGLPLFDLDLQQTESVFREGSGSIRSTHEIYFLQGGMVCRLRIAGFDD